MFDSGPPTHVHLIGDLLSLSHAEIKGIYVAQSKNVRALTRNRKYLKKDLNWSLLRDDPAIVAMKTKVFSLLYSAWSEAQFVQILHTPHGFSGSDIERIALTRKASGIGFAWKQMISEAIRLVGDPDSNHDLHEREKFLHDTITIYIHNPSVLRNKIAHGQWVIALNNGNSAINDDLTAELEQLDYVRTDVMFEVHQQLGSIIRDLLQSPKKAFHRDYWAHFVELEQLLLKTKDWTAVTKDAVLSKKPRKPEPS